MFFKTLKGFQKNVELVSWTDRFQQNETYSHSACQFVGYVCMFDIWWMNSITVPMKEITFERWKDIIKWGEIVLVR